MKNGIKMLTLTAAVLLSASYGYAQQQIAAPVPPPPPAPVAGMPPANMPALPPPMPGQPGPRIPAGPPALQALRALTTISGRIFEYTTNDRYEYDGFNLKTADKTISVKFPAHLGAQLMKAAPKGNQISVNGTYDVTPEGTAFRLFSLKAGSNTITDSAPPVDQNPQAEQVRDFSGTISELNHDPRGTINGVVLGSKTLVSLPPAAVEQLAGYLKVGTQISGTGIKRPVPSGVVTSKNVDVTDARTLSVSGQTYLLN